MRALGTLLFCVLLFPVVVVGGTESNELPQVIKFQLDRKFPGWRFSLVNDEVRQFFMERLPGARPNLIKGDFDGDGQADYAMLVEHANFPKDEGTAVTHVVEKLAFLKRGSGYKLYVLEEFTGADTYLYLTLAKKGSRGYDFQAAKRFTYPNDSISVGYFEKAGGTYIYSKGKFRYVLESD